jgi:anti-sigma factor RsiW
MMALTKKVLQQEPGDIEMLLPWHAAGTLNARDARRVDEALGRDPELARQYAVIREEYAETIGLNESLGAPTVRAMQKLFAAIDAEPLPRPQMQRGLSGRILGFFAGLSPRTLAWSGGLGALALLVQAGVIGAVLMKTRPAGFETASLSTSESGSGQIMTRALRQEGPPPPRALVRFAPGARIADITALLESYKASIIDGGNGSTFRLQFGSAAMTPDEAAGLLRRLQGEKIVSFAVAAP